MRTFFFPVKIEETRVKCLLVIVHFPSQTMPPSSLSDEIALENKALRQVEYYKFSPPDWSQYVLGGNTTRLGGYVVDCRSTADSSSVRKRRRR